MATTSRQITGGRQRELINRDFFEAKPDHHRHLILMVYSAKSLGLVISHDSICLQSGRKLK